MSRLSKAYRWNIIDIKMNDHWLTTNIKTHFSRNRARPWSSGIWPCLSDFTSNKCVAVCRAQGD